MFKLSATDVDFYEKFCAHNAECDFHVDTI